MSDDPFAEPSDSDRTIIRPRVSGVRVSGVHVSGVHAARPTAAPGVGAGDRVIRPVPKTGTNPLVAAASPLLAAAVRITADRTRAPDVDGLRRAMVAAMRRFETEALATGLDTRSLRAARYALCATIDDLVLSTPWGNSSSWAQQSMTSIFHNEVTGGERFFQILDQMQQDLGHQEPVVELMYLCLSLGFSGQYRVLPRGAAAVTELRDGIYRTIRQRRGEFERELSPHWRGIATAELPVSRPVPLWALGLGTTALAAAMFITFTFLLADISDVAYAELFALSPHGQITVPRPQGLTAAVREAGTPPAPAATPAAAPPATYLKLRQFLEPEIRAGLVEVLQDPQTITVRLTNRNMFGSGAANLAAAYAPLIGRIGEALNTETGRIMVLGFTDDQPIRTARFPSNFELSQARADAVAALLQAQLKDPRRLNAQGKGAGNPLAANTTADGRQQNRRTEIVLLRASDTL